MAKLQEVLRGLLGVRYLADGGQVWLVDNLIDEAADDLHDYTTTVDGGRTSIRRVSAEGSIDMGQAAYTEIVVGSERYDELVAQGIIDPT
jgi:hypothetical protein